MPCSSAQLLTRPPPQADCASQAPQQWQVEKLVSCSETLLQTVSSLRVAAVVNNLPALNRRIDERTNELQDADRERQQALIQLGIEISELLHELEESYYSTPPA